MFLREFLGLNLVPAILSFAILLTPARADITPTGDVSPVNPSTWTSSTDGYIGNTASGALMVNGGSVLLSRYGTIGNNSTATGIVDVAGTGSFGQ